MHKGVSVIGGALLVFASMASHAELVTNGGFEADSIGSSSWSYLSTITGWSSTGTFEIQKGSDVGGLSEFNTAYEGTQYLELNSTGLTTVSQSLATTIGEAYSLSFAFSGRSDTPSGLSSKIEVYWGGDKVATLSAKPTSSWIEITLDDLIATSASTLLSFKSVAPSGSYGSYLDGVSVVAAVPEPATYGMLAVGLGIVGWVGSRRKQRALA